MTDGVNEFGLIGGFAEGGGGNEAGAGGVDGEGDKELVEFAEGVEGEELGGGRDGGGGVAVEVERVFEVVEGEEAVGGGIEVDDEEFEGVCT